MMQKKADGMTQEEMQEQKRKVDYLYKTWQDSEAA